MRKNFNKTLVIAVVAILNFFFQVLSVQAATPPSTKEVYANAPKGMNLSDFIEKPDSYSGNIPSDNRMKIIKKGDATYDNPTDIIQMLDENSTSKQLASFWGTTKGTQDDKSYNILNLKKKQIISGWMYLGNSTTNPPDGMALVLQNDTRGKDAISMYNGNPAFGETLGVWGGSATPSMTSNTLSLNDGAIKNSFAMEFDTLRNTSIPTSTKGVDDSFDSAKHGESWDVKGQHIAWNYPGLLSSYTAVPVTDKAGIITLGTKYYYQFNHNMLANNPILSGYDLLDPTTKNSWRHFYFEYDPPTSGTTATIQYYFNEKFYDGTPKSFTNWDGKKFNIDISQFNASADNKVRWGFTASTGSPNSNIQTTAIIMETMPSIADVISKVTLKDITQDNRVIEDLDRNPKADSTVNDKDKLQLEYNLKYDSGISETKDITAKIDLPQHVDFTPDADGNIGEIDYGTEVEKISASQVTSGKNYNGETVNVLNTKLKSLDDTNNNVTVRLTGFAKAPDETTHKQTTVNQEHVSYSSDYYTNDDMSPKFIIDNEQLNISKLDDKVLNIKYNDKAEFKGTINYLKGSTFDGSDLTAYMKVDDRETSYASTVNVAAGSKQGSFDITDMNGTDIKPGQHKVSIYLVDSGRHISNTVEYTVNVEDYKKLLITQGESIVSIDQNGETPLKGSLTYDNGDSFSSTPITLYASIDGGEYQTQEYTTADTSKYDFQYVIKKDSLSGDHTVKLYASDGERKSDTVTYTLKDKLLTAKPDKSLITVKDNKPVTVSGTYVFSDGTLPKDYVDIKYQVKNEGIDALPEKTIQSTQVDGTFKFDLDPLLAKKPTSMSPDEWLADPDNLVDTLREGRNEITITVSDADGHVATPIVVVVNVPKIQPEISSSHLSTNVLSVSPIDFQMKYNYPDNSDYLLSSNDLTMQVNANDGNGDKMIAVSEPDSDSSTPIEFSKKLAAEDIGIKTPYKTDPYEVDVKVIDPYNRVSNQLTYNVTIMDKELKLAVKPSYSFKSINNGQTSATAGYIHRSGDWDIDVTSYKSRWKLFASQSQDFKQTQADGSIKEMTASMFFLNGETTASLVDQPVQIASDDSTYNYERTSDIANAWTDNSGILLHVNDYQQAGEYEGQISWTLVDSDIN